MQRWFKIFAAVTAVGLVVIAAAYAWSLQPSLFPWRYELKIATGPIGSDGQKILAAFIREVSAERPIVRLVPVPTDSLSASGKALMDGQVLRIIDYRGSWWVPQPRRMSGAFRSS